MIDTIALKQIITDMATSGKLSVCDSNDESIETLIRRLPEASKKRKRLLAQKFDYDELYDIPEHWRWMKLGKISSYGDTLTKVTPSEATGNTWILELEDIETGGKLLGKKYVCDKTFIGEKTAFKKNQVLYSKLRPYLKKVLVADENGISTPELIASDIYAGIEPEYIVLCLTNSYVDRVINRRSYGVKMPRVDAGFMVNLPIPIPPIQEQQRIVGVVKMAFEQVDTIATLQSAYSSDLEILKLKIIDAGIQGKLTEQLPEDGNAEDLYADIQEEKKAISDSGVLKGRKSKIMLNVDIADVPFSLPNNWKWIRLGDVAEIFGRIGFRGYKKADIVEPGNGAITISPSNIKTFGETVFDNCTYLSWEKYEESPEIKIEEGDVLIVKTGSSYGKVGITKNLPEKATINPQLAVMKYVLCDKEYLNFVLNSSMARTQYERFVIGAAIPTFSQEKLSNLLMPLPPLAEQKRIVKKIEAILCVN